MARAIAGHIPPFILEEVVTPLDPGLGIAQLRNHGPTAPDANLLYVAEAVVAALDDLGLAHALARALYRKALADDSFVCRIVPFIEDPGRAQQGAIAIRANTLSSRALRQFLDRTETKLCVVAATQADGSHELGTGFLVGPDLVLTAYHVLKTHIPRKLGGQAPPGPVQLFFDHYDGEPIADPAAQGIKARVVGLHADWLVASSGALPDDGLLDVTAEAAAAAAAADSLDFALIRLAGKIGLETRSAAGGERRSWVDLKSLGSPPGDEERIIIPQHPQGYPQRIDFGRLSTFLSLRDPSQTRMRYDTETQPGTSGAPCFNRNFEPVGLHNATYKPQGVTVANQAIRLARIVGLIEEHLPDPVDHSCRSPLWKVDSLDGEARGLFGREILLQWLESAGGEPPDSRAGRVYSAIGPVRRSGKTFSIDILREARRNASDRIVVLGTENGLIPEDVVDVIRAIAAELRIPQDDLRDMPPRPSIVLPENSQDGDKLSKWASEELPAWFDKLLHRNREVEVDRREEARRLRLSLQDNGFPVPPEVDRLADHPKPAREATHRWERIWIALDRLAEQRVSPEVKDLLVALMGGNLEERSVAPELRRMRWLLLGDSLGYAPGAATVETLDVLEIGWKHLALCVRHLAMSFGREVDDDMLVLLEVVFESTPDPAQTAQLEDPLLRLGKLQEIFGRTEPVMRRRVLS
ncbi:MAG TPA: serine protease [Allosphingosinicella sp.]|nr:serine protease [Allosphingosinicella sp.]